MNSGIWSENRNRPSVLYVVKYVCGHKLHIEETVICILPRTSHHLKPILSLSPCNANSVGRRLMLPMICGTDRSTVPRNAARQATNAINTFASTVKSLIEPLIKSATSSVQESAPLPLRPPTQRKIKQPRKSHRSSANNVGSYLPNREQKRIALIIAESSPMLRRQGKEKSATTPRLFLDASNVGRNLRGGMVLNAGSFAGSYVQKNGTIGLMVERSTLEREECCENSTASLRRKYTKSSSRSRFMSVTNGAARYVGSRLINTLNRAQHLVHLLITSSRWRVAELTPTPMFKLLILNVTGARVQHRLNPTPLAISTTYSP